MNSPFSPPRMTRNQTSRPEFLDARTEARLARCWHEEGDVVARNRLVTSHQALAMAAAKRAGGRGRELDSDILQQANIGLLKALIPTRVFVFPPMLRGGSERKSKTTRLGAGP
jgi:RNA polymerase sigma-32 factor